MGEHHPASLAICAAMAVATFFGPARAKAQTPAEPALCTDRPTKANATCTVPAGRFQMETDLYNTTRNDLGGVSTELTTYANPTIKYGVGARTDLQVNWAPYVEARAEGFGVRAKASGAGDVFIRLKHRFHEGDKTTAGVVPFIKLPTASTGIGNDKTEGGLALPVNLALPGGVSLTLGPEVDILADSDGRGVHAAYVNLVNLARPITPRLSVVGELWTSVNDDPSGSVTQASADLGAAYLVAPKLQFDVGANFGLNRDTPDSQLYLGLSTRF